MEDYRTTFDERCVRLSLVMPWQLRVSADAQRLIQVFSNLLDNALKFTAPGGAVVIEVIARNAISRSPSATAVAACRPTSSRACSTCHRRSRVLTVWG